MTELSLHHKQGTPFALGRSGCTPSIARNRQQLIFNASLSVLAPCRSSAYLRVFKSVQDSWPALCSFQQLKWCLLFVGLSVPSSVALAELTISCFLLVSWAAWVGVHLTSACCWLTCLLEIRLWNTTRGMCLFSDLSHGVLHSCLCSNS